MNLRRDGRNLPASDNKAEEEKIIIMALVNHRVMISKTMLNTASEHPRI